MIVVDYNQTAISNLMAEIGGRTDVELNVPLLRHMIINSFRGYKMKFGKDYGDIVIACDNRTYWRKAFFPNYKASRKKARAESGFDWKLIFDTLGEIREEFNQFFPYRVIDVEGAEADDVIAALAKWSQTNDLGGSLFPEAKPFLVVSGDHDFGQLQQYNNVKQFSPIQKKFIGPKRPPHEYVIEHTVKGDKGDGIPNILSGDGCFVDGDRQRPVTAKRLAEFIKDGFDACKTDEERRNWQRNATLVDFRFIPAEVEQRIINNYLSQPVKDRSQLYNYFVQHKMKNMLEVITDF